MIVINSKPPTTPVVSLVEVLVTEYEENISSGFIVQTIAMAIKANAISSMVDRKTCVILLVLSQTINKIIPISNNDTGAGSNCMVNHSPYGVTQWEL